jgi:hypothetical protein
MANRVSSSGIDKNYSPMNIEDISESCSFILENIINMTAKKSKTFITRQ